MLRLEAVELAQEGFHLSADWELPQGAIVAVIGPSGAGKSSLLSAIAGFFPPVSGEIYVGEQSLSGLSPGARPLTILFQDQNLFPHLTLAENIGLGLHPSLKLSKAEQARVAEVLEQVDLAGLGERKPAQLSGGQLARAALARAMLRARPILLLDEPFAALGPALKIEMLALVEKVARASGATVLMVTHDPADAQRIADLTVLVSDGTAHAPAPTEALFANPPAALQAYLGQ
ncbi:ATP-binding cassette domain-containing protein [Xinfangfangia sp. CPCC 101601]|uniref:ATP-binding cassette domain-containing protein n=1 Tax=Pseudogemmobacter lacusdianii TaxID=3069608 RepID=A0ABU0VWC5_9RHOB|nr:ATP-binding cassette domain-containing protein [Xinfangfangia sp. CPCC 101601]MDQ2065235.1 ATP-binding cassette domain-containing protein [Xinfangfangia sp. CPCC 101601]